MQLATADIAQKLLPGKLSGKIRPGLDKIDSILFGQDENATSQRMALMVFAIRVVSAAIALVSQVLLARWMGAFEYGIFVAVWAGILIASTITGLGLPSVIVRCVSEYTERSQPALVWGVIRGSLWLSVGVSTAVTALGCIVLLIFSERITDYFVLPMFLALLCLPAFSAEDTAASASRPFNWIKLAFLPTYILRPLAILGFMGAAILAGYPANANTAMWSALIATYSVVFVQTGLVFAKLKRSVDREPPQYRMKEWLLIAAPVFLVESFYALVTQVDVLFVSWLTNPEETAVYFAAAKILALVHFVYFAVRATASHRFAAFNASGKMDEYREFVRKTVNWTFWPSLALGLVMIVTGKYFLMLFGPEYVAGTSVLWVLTLGIVIRSSIGPAEAILVMSGKQNICAAVYFGALFVNVTLNLSLIPQYGMMGAAAATTLAMAFESAALYLIVWRRLGIHAFVVPKWNAGTGPKEDVQ